MSVIIYNKQSKPRRCLFVNKMFCLLLLYRKTIAMTLHYTIYNVRFYNVCVAAYVRAQLLLLYIYIAYLFICMQDREYGNKIRQYFITSNIPQIYSSVCDVSYNCAIQKLSVRSRTSATTIKDRYVNM